MEYLSELDLGITHIGDTADIGVVVGTWVMGDTGVAHAIGVMAGTIAEAGATDAGTLVVDIPGTAAIPADTPAAADFMVVGSTVGGSMVADFTVAVIIKCLKINAQHTRVCAFVAPCWIDKCI